MEMAIVSSHGGLACLCSSLVQVPPPSHPGAGRGQPDPGGRMVGKVLTGNGITRCEKGSYALVGGEELSDAERDHCWSSAASASRGCAGR
jgi:hypothetical protein